jgi:hypothetical protein
MADKKEQLSKEIKALEESSAKLKSNFGSVESELQRIEKAISKNVEAHTKINQKLIERKVLQQDLVDAEDSLHEIIKQNTLRIGDATDEQLERERRARADIIKLQEKIGRMSDEDIEKAKAKTDELEKQVELQEQEQDFIKKTMKLKQKQDEDQEKANAKSKAALDTFETATNSILHKTLGVSSAWKDTFIGSLAVVNEMKLGEEAADRFKKSLYGAALDIGPSMFEKIIESTFGPGGLMDSQDKARASFVATTGQIDTQIMSAMELQRQYAFSGVSVSSFGSAFTNLSNTFVNFNKLSTKQQGELAANVAMLETLGVSSQVVADTHANMALRLGMTTEQSQAQVRAFASLSGAGISAAEAVEGFNQSLPKLIEFGGKSIGIYKRLIVASKELNIDTQALLGTMSQFDTFETAADAAGRLNAVLGGDFLSSVDFMGADPEERIRMLIEAREESGKTWESMDRFERKALASAAGISDMNQAQAIFNQTLGGYDAAQRKASSSGMSAKELEERAKLTQTISDDMKSIMESFAVSFSGAISIIKDMTGWFAEANKTMLEWSHNMAGMGTVVAVAMGIVGFVATRAMKSFLVGIGEKILATGADVLAMKIHEKASKGMSSSIGGMGKASKMSAGPMLGLAAAGLGIGIGIGAAALGIAELAKSFKGLDNDQIKGVAGTLTVMLAGMGILVGVVAAAGPGAGLALAGLGVAATGMGLGIMLAAEGLAVFGEALSKIETEKFDAMGNLMLKMILAGVGAPLIVGAAVGISAMAVSFGLLGIAMSTMDTAALESMARILETITKITPEIGVRFVSITDGIEGVMKSSNSAGAKGASIIDAASAKISGFNNSPAPAAGSSTTLNITLELDKKAIQNVVIDVINGNAKVRSNG